MKTKKSTAFWVSLISLIGLYVLTLFVHPATLDSVGGAMVVSIAAAAGLYQSANVADNWQRSKNYRPELDRGAYDASN